MRGMTTVDARRYADFTDRCGLVLVAMVDVDESKSCYDLLEELSDFSSILSGCDVSFAVCDLSTARPIAVLEHVATIPSLIVYLDGRRLGLHAGPFDSCSLAIVVSDAIAEMLRRR